MKWENPHKVYNSIQYMVGTQYTLAIIVIILISEFLPQSVHLSGL